MWVLVKIGGTQVKDCVYVVPLQVNMFLSIGFSAREWGESSLQLEEFRLGAIVAVQLMFKVNPYGLAFSVHHVGVPSL